MMPSGQRETPGREIYTLQFVAELLHVHEDTVLKLIASGQLIAFKVGRQWRIHRSDLLRYRRDHENTRRES